MQITAVNASIGNVVNDKFCWGIDTLIDMADNLPRICACVLGMCVALGQCAVGCTM